MAKDPAVLFYTSDFLTGTMLMTDEEIGQYIKLLCLQHQRGRLTENHMLTICKAKDNEVFNKFTKDENGLYYNERMENEAIKRKSFTESRKNNGSKGGRPKLDKPNGKPNGKPKQNLTEDENENEDIIEIGKKNENINNKEYSEFIESFHNEEWFEIVAQQLSITPDKIESLAKEFELTRKLDMQYQEKSIGELRNWFINFAKVKKDAPVIGETRDEKTKRLMKMGGMK